MKGIQSLYTLLLMLSTGNLCAGPLHNLIEAHNANTRDVYDFIRQFPSLVNTKDTYGRTPLHRAAYLGHADITQALIIADASVDATYQSFGFRSTALGLAVRNFHAEVARVLLKAGARYDLEICFGEQKDLLIDAAFAASKHNGDPLQISDTIDVLLEAGHPVSEHAFQAAVNWCDIAIIRTLMRHGNFVHRLGVCRTNHASYPELLEEMLHEVPELSNGEQQIIETNIVQSTDWNEEQKQRMIQTLRLHGINR